MKFILEQCYCLRIKDLKKILIPGLHHVKFTWTDGFNIDVNSVIDGDNSFIEIRNDNIYQRIELTKVRSNISGFYYMFSDGYIKSFKLFLPPGIDAFLIRSNLFIYRMQTKSKSKRKISQLFSCSKKINILLPDIFRKHSKHFYKKTLTKKIKRLYIQRFKLKNYLK